MAVFPRGGDAAGEVDKVEIEKRGPRLKAVHHSGAVDFYEDVVLQVEFRVKLQRAVDQVGLGAGFPCRDGFSVNVLEIDGFVEEFGEFGGVERCHPDGEPEFRQVPEAAEGALEPEAPGSPAGYDRAGCDDHENHQRPKSRGVSPLKMCNATAASARATNTAVWLKRGGQRAGKRLRARSAPVTSRSRHATISRRAANPSPLTLNPLQRHTSRRRVKEKLWPAAAGARFVGVERIGFGVASSWRGAAKNQPPARTDKRADAAREKGNAVTNRERYRFFSALFKKVLAVNCSNGSVFLFSQIPSLKSVCLPSINSCGKAAAK